MIVVCSACWKQYDDTYRLTFCPHDHFQMQTVVYRGGKRVGVAHTIEELRRLMQ